jgi:Ca2+-binding RTX toxin-like protein
LSNVKRSSIAALLSGVMVSSGAAAGNAAAATVQVDQIWHRAWYQGDSVVFRAGPAQANDVVLTKDGRTVVASDRVPIAAGAGCVSETATVVRCSLRHDYNWHFHLSLSDGDDQARGPHDIDGELNGGSGDDVLTGSPNDSNTFRGGPGDDRMVGGTASDSFFAEPGSDTMLGGGPTAYSDNDGVDYGGRRAGVHADLEGDRDDGLAGERDLIGADIESLYGGQGHDVLVGGPGRNALEGRDGRDTLIGGEGPDTLAGDPYVVAVRRSADRLVGGPGDDGLQGGSGADRIAAGPGRDWVDAGPGGDRVELRDGSADAAECGGGSDVARQDRRDFLMRGCERRRSRQPARATAILWGDAGDRVSLYMACPSGRRRTCDGRVTVEAHAPLSVTPRYFSLAPGSVGWVYVFIDGRSSDNPEPSLEDATLVLSSTDGAGRVAEQRIPLRDVPDEAPGLGL